MLFMFSGSRLNQSLPVMSSRGNGAPSYKKLVRRPEKECSVITGTPLVASSCGPSSPGTFRRQLWICSQHTEAASQQLSCCLAQTRLVCWGGLAPSDLTQNLSYRRYFKLPSNKNYAAQCKINAIVITPMEISTWDILCAFFCCCQTWKFSFITNHWLSS